MDQAQWLWLLAKRWPARFKGRWADGAAYNIRPTEAELTQRHPWLAEKVRQAGPCPFSDDIEVVGLARLQPGKTVESVLTDLDREERVLHSVFGYALNMKFFEVLSVVRVCRVSSSMEARRLTWSMLSGRTRSIMQFKLATLQGHRHWLHISSSVGGTMQATAGIDVLPTFAMFVEPPTVAHLVVQGLFARLPWFPTWQAQHQLCNSSPFPGHYAYSVGVRSVLPELTEQGLQAAISTATLTSTAQRLQHWAGSILDHHPEDRHHLEGIVLNLMHGARSLGDGRDHVVGGSHHWRYRSSVIVHTIMMCGNLCDAHKLRQTMRTAAKLCFPAMGQAVDDAMDSARIPSGATISRGRYWVDVVFMLYMRDVHRQQRLEAQPVHVRDERLAIIMNVPCFHYLKTDASPQGGREWLLSMSVSVHPTSLISLHEAVVGLHNTDREAVESDPSAHVEVQGWEDCIRRSVSEHIFPPVGLGKLALSVHHKLNCILWQLRLEVSGLEDLADYMCGTVSISTDQGAEIGLAEAPSIDLAAVFPDQRDMDIEVDGDQSALDAEIDVDLPEPPLVRAAALYERVQHAWPFALVVAGANHICHNAAEELMTNIPGWSDFIADVKRVADFLSVKLSLDRFKELCVKGTPVEQLARQFV